ncbi:MAG: hypothetical protein HY261_01520 [Chloroflexi bacterium]|nr:hypothetical protein [Chloroflexota bacterium]
MPGFDGANKAADVERAKALLKEAGLVNPKWRVVSSNFGALAKGAEVIATQIKAIGVDAQIQLYGADLNEFLRQGAFDLNVNVATLDFDDPAAYVTPWVRTNGSLNWGKWSISKIDQLLDEADRTFDQAKRRQLITDVQREILAQLPSVPVLFSTGPNFWQKEIRNWPRVYTALSPAYKFEQVWLAQ